MRCNFWDLRGTSICIYLFLSCCLEDKLLGVISIIKKEAWDYPLKHILTQ